MNAIEKHSAAAVLAAVAVYLKSPVAALAPILVYAIAAAETIFSKASRDAEIMALIAKYEGYDKRLSLIQQDINNVSERAKNILGENF